MYPQLQYDLEHIEDMLQRVQEISLAYYQNVGESPAAVAPPSRKNQTLPKQGMGGLAVVNHFLKKVAPHLAASGGPRYLGFVTGGATPAALIGDWLTSTFDQNVASDIDSIAPLIEDEAIDMLRTLFGLPDEFSGSFVSGATMSNFAALAIGRQWCAKQIRYDVAKLGLYGLPQIRVLAATPHSSIYKALSMLGMGRSSLIKIKTIPGREAIDIDHLRFELAAARAELIPAIVVGSGGTVNTVDFDDLTAIGALKKEFTFWYHVDAAFGGFAACTKETARLTKGMDSADSITIDAHKWLNVPYDSAMVFTRHPDIGLQVFQNSAAYLGDVQDVPAYVHRTPQNSRRFRALPAWFSLLAYGAAGYEEIVTRCCRLAQRIGEKIAGNDRYDLLAPVNLNVVCFAPASHEVDVGALLMRLRDDGRVFATPTEYGGRSAIRLAFSNWRTTDDDVELVWQALQECL
ncbi:MAG: pyridoxal-dependent decarboxylase [Ardenticatenaceae bacterium]|nr:pyridoxal-dependent decarboxylase [Ardenticatenaceae bacterium]